MHNANCKLQPTHQKYQIVLCIVSNFWTLHNTRCTLHALHCAHESLHSTWHSANCIQHRSIYSTHCTTHCILHTAQCSWTLDSARWLQVSKFPSPISSIWQEYCRNAFQVNLFAFLGIPCIFVHCALYKTDNGPLNIMNSFKATRYNPKSKFTWIKIL